MRTAFTTPVVVALGFVATAIFAQPVVISPEGQKAGAPDVAINAKGQLAILWVDRSPQDNASAGHDHNHDRHLSTADLYVTISPDGGKTFNAPVKVNSAEGVVLGSTTEQTSYRRHTEWNLACLVRCQRHPSDT